MINSLEEAIRHAEEVAVDNESMCEYNLGCSDSQYREWKHCAAEHRQLAKWLRELKVKRQIITNVKEQCKVLKRNDFQNRDYGIGFISALGNIEGLIAYTEEQLEVKAGGVSN